MGPATEVLPHTHTIFTRRMSYSISFSQSLPLKACLHLNSQWLFIHHRYKQDVNCFLIKVHQNLGSDYFGKLIWVFICWKIPGLCVPKLFVHHLKNPVLYSALTNDFWTVTFSLVLDISILFLSFRFLRTNIFPQTKLRAHFLQSRQNKSLTKCSGCSEHACFS